MDQKISSTDVNDFARILEGQEPSVLAEWVHQQLTGTGVRRNLSREELTKQCDLFLSAFLKGARTASSLDVKSVEWDPVREVTSEVALARTKQGFSSGETAIFIFSLKRPLSDVLVKQPNGNPLKQMDQLRALNEVLDQLGLLAVEDFQKRREEIIVRQQEEMLELSTPVVKLWDGVLALPVIGTLDSARTQIVMENLLQEIVRTGSTIAIIDITGVPTVDTLVAQHLLKTVAAARLMGADCIISGIRPQIAATIVHLGVELTAVSTKATLADGFALALRKIGLSVTKARAGSKMAVLNSEHEE